MRSGYDPETEDELDAETYSCISIHTSKRFGDGDCIGPLLLGGADAYNKKGNSGS